MPVTMQLAGETAMDVIKQLEEFTAMVGGNPLHKIETETLLAELRDRLAKNGQVVKIVPFADKETSEGGNEPNGRRTRQKKETPTIINPVEQAEQTIADNPPEASATAVVTTLAPTTLEEVKSALNAFAAVNGQVEARKVMQDVGGSPALKDVPAEKYGDLVLALQNGSVRQAA